MSKNTKSNTETINPDDLKSALEQMFTSGGWEIPDDAVVGAFKHKVDQLQARVDTLTQQLANLCEELDKEELVAGRVDGMALAEQENDKGKKASKTPKK